jgi:hypothetical protein
VGLSARRRSFSTPDAHATGGYRPDPYHLLLAAYRQFFDYVVFILSDIFLQPADVRPHADDCQSDEFVRRLGDTASALMRGVRYNGMSILP